MFEIQVKKEKKKKRESICVRIQNFKISFISTVKIIIFGHEENIKLFRIAKMKSTDFVILLLIYPNVGKTTRENEAEMVCP